MKRYLLCCISLFTALAGSNTLLAAQRVVNIYGWSNEVPPAAIRNFEQETGIKVNFSTYENNEIMYSKLRTTRNAGYDLIMPSSYFVDRMRRQNMLDKIDKSQIPNWKNLDPALLNPAYDPNSNYSMPHIWGVTGMFVNDGYFKPDGLKKWSDLWSNKYQHQLLMLDDTREMFSMALMSMGYSANDQDPVHLKAAFERLKALMPNIKVFASDAVASILIDEDATIGMAWNGDVYKSSRENKQLHFIYPAEGFVIWVDTFSIPKDAPHKSEAYAFLNYLLRPDVGKEVADYTAFPIANKAGQKLLPESVQKDPAIYPPESTLKRGQFQTDLRDDTLALLTQYWEELKISG